MSKAEKLAKEAKKEIEKESGVKESGGSNFGLLLVIVGLIWLAINQGWIPENWPIWPSLVILAGLWLILARKKK